MFKLMEDKNDLPDRVMIETFMGCNLQCSMCPVPQYNEKMNGRTPCAMKYEVFCSIIDQLSDHSRRIHLNQMGEPLLNPRIQNFVKYAKEKGHIVSLTTNGSKLSKLIAEKLIAAEIDEMTISFDGAKRETYEQIREGACYEETLNNVDNLLETIKNHGANCCVNIDCIMSDITEPEKQEIEDLWKTRKVNLRLLLLDDWGGSFNIPDEYGKKELQKWKINTAGADIPVIFYGLL